MHLILHIFKKDARRLWWAIGVTLLLQARLAYLDARRADAIAPTEEGWLTALLLLSWACLLVLAVQDDPLPGDRQFWITRPYRWPVLLGSKLLFAAACVHVPYLLADIAVLGARGFQPWQWVPQLAAKQLMLAAGLTLPAIALAAAFEGFANLALTGVIVAGAAVYLAGISPSLLSHWRAAEDVRAVALLALLAVAAAAIIAMQFARRATLRSRILGIAALLVAGFALGYLSPVFLVRVRAAVEPIPARIAFRLDAKRRPSAWPLLVESGWVRIALPVNLSGVPGGSEAYFDLPALEVETPDRRYRGTTVHDETFGNAKSELQLVYAGPDWLMFWMRRPVYEALKNGAVEVKATLVIALHRMGQRTWMPVGANRPAAGAGRCFNTVMADPSRGPAGMSIVRVVCESPAGFSEEPRAALWLPSALRTAPAPNEQESRWAGQQLTNLSGTELLSPLGRVQTSILLTQVSREDLASARVEIVPDKPEGWAVVDLDAHGIRLQDYAAGWSP